MKKQMFTLGLGLLAAVSATAQIKRTYTIPTVVHVLNSTAYGKYVLTEEDVKAGIKNLNEIMQGKKAIGRYGEIVNGFQDKIAGLDIEFVLAKKDKDGNKISGVVLESADSEWADHTSSNLDNIRALSKSTPSNKYLNIYVYNRYTAPDNFQSGVAYRPGEEGNSLSVDGIFVTAWAWPATYPLSGSQWQANKGYGYANVLAHEAGHYLNLIHMHGAEAYPNGPAGCPNVDDLVEDTAPIGSDYDKILPSSKHKDCNLDPANSNNMMTYSWDANMFTKGQVERMEAALQSSVQSRNKLWSYKNLLATGVIKDTDSKYCTAAGNSANAAKEYITKVSLTDDDAKKVVLSQSSTQDKRYQDHTAKAVNVTKGKTYTLLVDVNDIFNEDKDHDYAAAWFDWNNNGAFENSEKLELWSPYQTTSTKAPYLMKTTDADGNLVTQARYRGLEIPENAALGKVRMRIRTANNDNTGANIPLYAPFSMSPCGSDLYGEVEDYTLNIQAAPASAGRAVAEASSNSDLKVFPTVASNEVNVNAANDLKINSIDVIDMNGNVVKTVASPNADNSINVGDLNTGTYILNVHAAEATYTSKFIKK